jgi:hypothetical protein
LIGGVLALLQSMGVLDGATDIFWGSILIAAGLVSLAMIPGGYWWAAFPGFALLAVGTLIFLPESLEDFGGALFLGGLGLGFWLAYLTDRTERWWSLIPAGVLTTLALIPLVPERFEGVEAGGLLFLGLAVTFLLVALLARMKWAYWPALALGILGLLISASFFQIVNTLWALMLIGAGGLLLYRYFRGR